MSLLAAARTLGVFHRRLAGAWVVAVVLFGGQGGLAGDFKSEVFDHLVVL